MIYDKTTRSWGDGQWHCPFSRDWVERMKKAAGICRYIEETDVEAYLNNDWRCFNIPPGEFLSEEQDVRGLPLSWCEQEREKYDMRPECCVAIYDYCTVPEIIVTNGKEDWPFVGKKKVLMA